PRRRRPRADRPHPPARPPGLSRRRGQRTRGAQSIRRSDHGGFSFTPRCHRCSILVRKNRSASRAHPVPTHPLGRAGSRTATIPHTSGQPAGSDERRSPMTTTVEIAPEAPSAAELGPVRPSERIAELDILRGFALLGILVVNLFVFYTPLALWRSPAVDLYPGRLDKAVLW